MFLLSFLKLRWNCPKTEKAPAIANYHHNVRYPINTEKRRLEEAKCGERNTELHQSSTHPAMALYSERKDKEESVLTDKHEVIERWR